MPIFRPRKFTFFPFLILFKRIESIDMTPCVISFLVLFYYTFYSRYNTDWIANTENGLDPNNSVLKRLWCTGNTQELVAPSRHD